MIIWKHQFVNNRLNVWRKIVILTDISNGYKSFGSIFTMIAFIYDECYTRLSRTFSTWSWPASWRRRTWTAWWTRSGGPTCSTGGSESPPNGQTTDGNFGKEPLKSPAVMYFSRIRRESPIPLAVDNLVIMVSLSFRIRLSQLHVTLNLFLILLIYLQKSFTFQHIV